jgi:hypothetical protein
MPTPAPRVYLEIGLAVDVKRGYTRISYDIHMPFPMESPNAIVSRSKAIPRGTE